MCVIPINKLQFQITFQFMNEYENKKISILRVKNKHLLL